MFNIGFGEEITQVDSIEVNFTHLIWSSDQVRCFSQQKIPINCNEPSSLHIPVGRPSPGVSQYLPASQAVGLCEPSGQ